MRIGLFTDTYPPFINGVSTSVQMLKSSLEKAGHEVFVVTVNPDNMKYVFEDNNKVIRIPGIPIGIYDYRLTGIYPLRAINIIKKWKLDVIHSHTEFGIGTFARVISRQLNIPLVHTYHTLYEDYVHYITKGYFNKSSKKIVEYLTLFYCDKTATELIVPTKKIYDLFKDKYKVDKNIYIIPTGIEIERFFTENIEQSKVDNLRRKLNLKKEDFVLLFVGRLAEEKNIPYLIEAYRDIVRKDKNYKFIIVGDGPDFSKYLDLVKKFKIEDNVIFTGKVSWEDVPIYYSVADLFLTASQSETQGLTVIEAMAASVPPVVINDESFTNTVIDDLNGKIFRTKKELRDSITSLKANPDKLKRMSNQARINSMVYSSKFFAENVLNVYNNAIVEKKNNYGVFGRIAKKFKDKKDK